MHPNQKGWGFAQIGEAHTCMHGAEILVVSYFIYLYFYEISNMSRSLVFQGMFPMVPCLAINTVGTKSYEISSMPQK